MKKIFLSIAILFSACINAQTSSESYSFAYLVGIQSMSGYEIQTCDSSLPSFKVKVFENGKSAPVLQSYISSKSKYIGGVLENEKGKTTIIKNISLTASGTTLLFSVEGNDFTMSFTLVNGAILKEDDSVTVFYTEKIGPWKINKKK